MSCILVELKGWHHRTGSKKI